MSCDGWERRELGSLVEQIFSGGTPRTSESAYWGGEFFWLSSGETRNRHIYRTEKTITQEGIHNSSTRLAKKGDVVIAAAGQGHTRGQVSICMVDTYINQSVVAIRTSQSLDSRFLFHHLSNRYEELRQISDSNSIRGSITTKTMKSLLVDVPPLGEQQAIAATLSCLDDKIELNNRINKVLEEMAQALFKSWFVDFEPFQDGEFVDSELGPIPKGWKVGSLDEIADFLNGLAMQRFRCEGDNYLPVIKIKELNQGFTDSNSDRARTDIPDKYIIRDGDIIFSWSGTLVAKLWTGGVGGLNQHLFKVTSDSFPKWFYYQWVLYHLEEFRSIAKDKATTMGHIKRSHLSNARVVIPDEESLAMLSETMEPIVNQIVDNSLQSNTLIALRDTLLPKLMSGEVRVPLNCAETEAAAASS